MLCCTISGNIKTEQVYVPGWRRFMMEARAGAWFNSDHHSRSITSTLDPCVPPRKALERCKRFPELPKVVGLRSRRPYFKESRKARTGSGTLWSTIFNPTRAWQWNCPDRLGIVELAFELRREKITPWTRKFQLAVQRQRIMNGEALREKLFILARIERYWVREAGKEVTDE